MTITSDGERLTGLWFDDQRPFDAAIQYACSEAKIPVFEQAIRWLDIYFSGQAPDFMPELKMISSPFRMMVWNILRTIPYGQTTTYGAIAQIIAKQNTKMSAQAVGGAVAHNAFMLIIPCHRVLGSNGSLTGYAAGLERKRALLSLEHAVYKDNRNGI